MKPSAPRYSEGGWLHWPDNPDFSYQFAKVLGTAQEGASTISECFLTAARITSGDSESWFDAWARIGEMSKRRANEAFAKGGTQLAVANWLRASNYFRTAETFLKYDDDRRARVLESMRECSRQYLEYCEYKTQIITIPYEGAVMEAYFIESPARHGRPLPVVVGVGGADAYKDELLYTMRRSATANGLSLLLIDTPGSEPLPNPDRLRARFDVEVPIARWIDYLETRTDVDANRIAIYGSGLGGAHATRSASRDTRFAAAVCDAGQWDQHERGFLANLDSRDEDSVAVNALLERNATHPVVEIKCPCLLVTGERDFLDIEEARLAYNAARNLGMPIEWKLFSTQETAAGPGHVDNPTLAHEYAFNWIRQTMNVEQEIQWARDTRQHNGAALFR